MYGVVTSGTNRILSVGELLRTLVVVLKHAFTKEAHCTPSYTQTHQSLVLTSAMDKVPVKVFLFQSCTVCLSYLLYSLNPSSIGILTITYKQERDGRKRHTKWEPVDWLSTRLPSTCSTSLSTSTLSAITSTPTCSTLRSSSSSCPACSTNCYILPGSNSMDEFPNDSAIKREANNLVDDEKGREVIRSLSINT